MKKNFFVYFLIGAMTTQTLANSYYISPATGKLSQIKSINPLPTVNGVVYFDPFIPQQNKIIKSDRVLLQKILELSDYNQITQTKLAMIKKTFNNTVNMINSLDITSYIANYIAIHTYDLKTITYDIWDLFIKPKLEAMDGMNQTLLDVMETTVKTAIDVALIKAKVQTSLLGPSLDKVIGKLYGLAFSELSETALGLYTLALNVSKLTNVVIADLKTGSVIKEQARYVLKQQFILDYILKFKSDINKMAKYTQEKTKLKVTPNNFWHLFYYYSMYTNNELFYEITHIANEYNSFELFQLAQETNTFINVYGTNSLAQGILRETINVPSYDKSYRFHIAPIGNKTINTLYYLPKNYDKAMDFQYDDYNKMVFFGIINGKIGDSQEKKLDRTNQTKKMRLISNVLYTLEVSNEYGELIETQKYPYMQNFYVPSFFEDVQPNNQFMPFIATLFNNNIINGYYDRNFHPNGNVSVGEFIKMVTNAIYPDNNISGGGQFSFETYLKYLNKKGIDTRLLNLTPVNSTSIVNQTATRGYVAKILANILKKDDKTHYTFQYTKCSKNNIDDWDECSSSLRSKRIINGYADGTFKPDIPITRGEVSKMIISTAEWHKISLQNAGGN